MFLAQVSYPAGLSPLPPADLRPPPSTAPLPPIAPSPPSPPLLQPPVAPSNVPVPVSPPGADTITVTKFHVVGSTVFSAAEFDAELKPFLNRPLTFAELLQVRSAITKLYVDRDYVTTGAFIPEGQELNVQTAEVTIQVVEGQIEQIRVSGLRRLDPNYVSSRLALVGTPLNKNRLVDALKLLQLNPLIASISANLTAGSRPGSNILEVQVQEAPTFSSQLLSNNGRSPSVGTVRRGITATQANLLGLGDSLTLSYTNTDGSNEGNLSYSLPINPHNGTLSASFSMTNSRVTESPFDELNIRSNSRYYQITLRQPIVQTPSTELALGLTADHSEGSTSLLGVPYPLSPGADSQGQTRISALRFFQEYTYRNQYQVLALRSQFSMGINVLNATNNSDAARNSSNCCQSQSTNALNISDSPDSHFFTWHGQAQFVQLLSKTPDAIAPPLLLVRGEMQIADRPLLSQEQFGLGGMGSVRGYRQDKLLTDSGLFASVELQIPVLRIPSWQAAVQLISFVDIGKGWNLGNTPDPDPSTLASVGLGLQFIQSNRVSARLDWGIPLIRVDSTKRTWQENGLYFSIEFKLF